jgi:hypothetical protein
MKTIVAALAAFAVAGGIAYAAVPDAGGAYHACMLKKIGTIRIIDPDTQHCSSLETEISFNRRGPAGASPTVAQVAAGDQHCANGGAAITDANGSTAYVCSGADGRDGAPFSGTFTSPNGQYSLSVTDSGVSIAGADVAARFSGNGIDIQSPAALNLTVGGNMTVAVGSALTTSVGAGYELDTGSALTLTAGKNATISTGEALVASAGTNLTLTAQQTLAADAGQDALLTAGRNFSLIGSGTGRVQAGGTLILRGATIDMN